MLSDGSSSTQTTQQQPDPSFFQLIDRLITIQYNNTPAAAAADQAEFDPKWERQENDTSFSYRIHLSGTHSHVLHANGNGFPAPAWMIHITCMTTLLSPLPACLLFVKSKQVDGAGRLTVSGQPSDGAAVSTTATPPAEEDTVVQECRTNWKTLKRSLGLGVVHVSVGPTRGSKADNGLCHWPTRREA